MTDSEHATVKGDSARTPALESPETTVCYRCDDPIPEGRAIRLSSDPPAALAGRYAPVARACCPDCAAGIGLLAFTPVVRPQRGAD